MAVEEEPVTVVTDDNITDPVIFEKDDEVVMAVPATDADGERPPKPE